MQEVKSFVFEDIDFTVLDEVTGFNHRLQVMHNGKAADEQSLMVTEETLRRMDKMSNGKGLELCAEVLRDGYMLRVKMGEVTLPKE